MNIACAFLLISARICCGRLIKGLENSYNWGEEKFPKTPTDTYKIVVDWKQDTRNAVNIFKVSETNGKVDFSYVVYDN